ncbi:MAG: hypothetical protein HQK53_19335, partial [Oligoflexia bacterium]|nr:hypothetical protein [Oligoflexia bacterium]
SWGGKFNIESTVGVGTRMIMTMPKASAPSWFVSSVHLRSNSAIVVLDDDQGIHQTWDSRFAGAGLDLS